MRDLHLPRHIPILPPERHAWHFYHIEYKVCRDEAMTDNYAQGTYWTPYGNYFIERDIEEALPDDGKEYWFEWKVIGEHIGPPKGYIHQTMHTGH